MAMTTTKMATSSRTISGIGMLGSLKSGGKGGVGGIAERFIV